MLRMIYAASFWTHCLPKTNHKGESDCVVTFFFSVFTTFSVLQSLKFKDTEMMPSNEFYFQLSVWTQRSTAEDLIECFISITKWIIARLILGPSPSPSLNLIKYFHFTRWPIRSARIWSGIWLRTSLRLCLFVDNASPSYTTV